MPSEKTGWDNTNIARSNLVIISCKDCKGEDFMQEHSQAGSGLALIVFIRVVCSMASKRSSSGTHSIRKCINSLQTYVPRLAFSLIGKFTH